MTLQQKQLVRESFPAIREVAGPLSLLFYGRVFELDPSLRPMFRQDIVLQGRKLMDMLTAVVDNLENLDGLEPVFRAMGQRHAGYGVLPQHYPTVERALIWALGQALESDFDPELRSAWLSVINHIGTVMLQGAAELPGTGESSTAKKPDDPEKSAWDFPPSWVRQKNETGNCGSGALHRTLDRPYGRRKVPTHCTNGSAAEMPSRLLSMTS